MDELVGQELLAYDVYDGQGTLLFKAGEMVSEKAMLKAADRQFYRHQNKLPIQWIVGEEMPNLSPHLLEQTLKQTGMMTGEAPSHGSNLITIDEAQPFLTSMHHFWQKLEAGEEADIALLDVMQDKLVGDIITRMDQLQYLNQLRIRDEVTYSHTLDVTAMSIALGRKAGLSRSDLKTLALGALLHDLGKLFVPKPIMFKQSRLNETEFDVMQLHPEMGYRVIIENLKLPKEVALPALEHQELWGGGGYPAKLQGDQIHFFSQIVKIADVYDALTSARPYKEAICSRKAIRIMLLEGSGSFNPELLQDFLELANYSEEVPSNLAQQF
jgi:HD-GYP domain-containing protein (c-di-GMP phosphodiesterase class II)